jgi:hypothetical protein
VDPAEALGRLDALKASHGMDPLFDASMVLFQMIIEVTVGAMEYCVPQLRFDGSGIGIMAISGNALRNTISDCAR